MNQEQSQPSDIGHLPTMPAKLFREKNEQQAIYRKTLVAAFSSQELPADECIEDIFAGGDGWGRYRESSMATQDSLTNDEHDTSDVEHLQVPGKSRNAQRGQSSDLRYGTRGGRAVNSDKSQSNGSDSRRVTPENTTPSNSSDDRKHNAKRQPNEVSEIDVREDLRSWEIRAPID